MKPQEGDIFLLAAMKWTFHEVNCKHKPTGLSAPHINKQCCPHAHEIPYYIIIISSKMISIFSNKVVDYLIVEINCKIIVLHTSHEL